MKRIIPILALVAALLPIRTPAEPTIAESAVERMARQVVALTNAERAAAGLPPLKLQTNLRVAACWLAQDMAEKNYFSHTDKQGRTIDPRLTAHGYRRYQSIGENIAVGQENPAAALTEWMKSPGHRDNILSADWNEIGVGCAFAKDSKFQRYWVQDFGSRHNVCPVVINGEQPETNTAQVHLYIYGAGWAEQMRISNDGKTWTPWEKYASLRDWTLAEGSGERVVYVELQKGEQTRRDQDTIILLPQSASKQ